MISHHTGRTSEAPADWSIRIITEQKVWIKSMATHTHVQVRRTPATQWRFESLELHCKILLHLVAWLFYPRQSLNILHQLGLGDEEVMRAKVLKLAGLSGNLDGRPPPYAWSHLKGERPLCKISPGHLVFLLAVSSKVSLQLMITYDTWKVLSLCFQQEQMMKIIELIRVWVHAEVLDCKETGGADNLGLF